MAGGGGISAQEWGMVIWLSPINCNFVIQLSWLHNGSMRTLTLNVSKSSFIIFHPPQKKLQQIPIKINSENIPEKNSTKYLGAIMDKHLNKERTYSLKILNYKSIGQLSKLRHYIPQKLLMTIYFAFLQPH